MEPRKRELLVVYLEIAQWTNDLVVFRRLPLGYWYVATSINQRDYVYGGDDWLPGDYHQHRLGGPIGIVVVVVVVRGTIGVFLRRR